MRTFEEIYAIAADRKGGPAALEALLSGPLSKEEIAAQPDDRWLAEMAKAIFQAGFSWKVIEAKWEGFEEAFDGFQPGPVSFYHEEHLDRLLSDKRIVRNGQKIKAVVENARFLMDLKAQHGSVGAFFANWPSEDFIGLTALLKKEGARLGGFTGQRLCRVMGVDSFILSTDVIRRLIAEGVVDKPPSSKKEMAAVQATFNAWSVDSGRSLTEISKVLAYSL